MSSAEALQKNSDYILVIHYRKLYARMKTPGTETGREKVPEKNSLEPHGQYCMPMTRHAPTKQKGGDLKGHAYKANSSSVTNSTLEIGIKKFNIISILQLFNTYLNAPKYQKLITKKHQSFMVHTKGMFDIAYFSFSFTYFTQIETI